MPPIGTKRRRVRRLDPAVLRAVHTDLATNASAPRVLNSLVERQAAGELPEDAALPSERTIRNMARAMQRDDSGVWRLEDADPATAQLVLRALRDVVHETGGRVDGFTKREAALLATVNRATEPRYTGWQCYLWVRFYQSWVVTERDAQDVMLALAALSKDGPWPITHFERIDRVFQAVAGWLPPELIEVQS